jgi:sporulation protein YlmC with PRC-barrel domain
MNNKILSLALLTGTLAAPAIAHAQMAGTSTVSVTEATQVAMGWSVKKSILGKTVYNDAGEKIGKVEDMIISPRQNVSYLIIGAGGFVGIGRHDVAVPVAQVREEGGKILMAGATKDTIKSMPPFNYASDTTRRDQFVAAAEQDIALGQKKLADLQKRAGVATSDAKAALDKQVASLDGDLKAAQGKLSELKQASAKRWHEFEGAVSAATARLRKAVEMALS